MTSLLEQANPCQSHLKALILPDILLKPLQTNVIRGVEGVDPPIHAPTFVVFVQVKAHVDEARIQISDPG